MKSPASRLGVVVAAAAMGLAALTATSASADVPSFDRCPRSAPDLAGCLVIASTDGAIAANGHNLPLTGAGLKIEGGLAPDGAGGLAFVPPASGAALTAKPVAVPGGLFGTRLPYNLNQVKATVEQAGPITYDFFTYTFTAAIRIRFSNPLLGGNCVIGSSAAPIALTLTPSVFGAVGTPPGTVLAVTGQTQVDTAFSVPAATGCGIVAQTQVTKAINDNLGLPSAAGANRASLTVDHYLATP
jgi:hypothetical protein